MDTFKYTRTGITFVYIGLVLLVLAVIAVLLAGVLQAAPLLLAVPLLIIAALLLSMIGRILCLTVPKEVGASGLIYAAVACDVISLVGSVSAWVPGVPNLSGFSGLFAVAAQVLFLVFLKQLALFIQDSGSAARASNLLKFGIGLIVVLVAQIVLLLTPFRALASGAPLLIFLMLVVGFFIYNRLLSGLRRSLYTVADPVAKALVEQ